MSSGDPRERTAGRERPRERRIVVDPTRGPLGRAPLGGQQRVTRDNVLDAATLDLVAGVWLAISPWVLAYTATDARWNPIIFGAIVALLALVRIAMPARAGGLSAISAAIGVWMFIAGFWLADSVQAAWNDWMLGIIVFALAMISLASAASGGERHTLVP